MRITHRRGRGEIPISPEISAYMSRWLKKRYKSTPREFLRLQAVFLAFYNENCEITLFRFRVTEVLMSVDKNEKISTFSIFPHKRGVENSSLKSILFREMI